MCLIDPRTRKEALGCGRQGGAVGDEVRVVCVEESAPPPMSKISLPYKNKQEHGMNQSCLTKLEANVLWNLPA